MLKLVVISMLVTLANCQTTGLWKFSYDVCNFGTGSLIASINHMFLDAVSFELYGALKSNCVEELCVCVFTAFVCIYGVI